MQEFYFCAAYLAFQKEKLADLDVSQISRDRRRRIEGRKRVRQEHKTYAENLRAHAASHDWTKPKNSVIKENAAKHRERKDATQRMAISRSRRAEQSQAEDDDVFRATDELDWGSQASLQPVPVTVTASRVWSTHPLPSGLRPARSAFSTAVAEGDEAEQTSEDEDDHDFLASEFCDRIHALWLSRCEADGETDYIRISQSTLWEFEGCASPDNWAYTGHLLARNISHATLEKTKFIFVTGKSERKKAFRTLMCKVSNTLGKRKTTNSVPADYAGSLLALEEDTSKYVNDLWSGEKRRTNTKRTVRCQVQIRLHYNAQGVWSCRIGAHVNHNHQTTAAAAPVVVPAAVADAVSDLHVTASLSVTQASRICVANCKSFIPRSTLRRLLHTCHHDATWGQGGQCGLLQELMLDPNMDLCTQFQKTSGNRIEAMVTVARLNGMWTIVEGGLVKARQEYVCMVITLKRLETLHKRHPTNELADRIAAARAVLNGRLAPGVRQQADVAPGMQCTGDYFEVFEHSPPSLIELHAVLLAALGELGSSKLRLTHVCYCTLEDRELAMMHPHKIMLDTTCKTNGAKKHFGYLSGNTTNHNWFKWFGEIY